MWKVRFGLNLKPIPILLPGERVLFSQGHVLLITIRMPPSYGLLQPARLPPMDQSFYLTDRRMVIVASNLHLYNSDISAWYPGMNPPTDPEVITSVDVGRTHFGAAGVFLLGLMNSGDGRPGLAKSGWRDYLEINSETTKKPWYRSARARLRFYLDDVDSAHKIVLEAMALASSE